MLTSRDKFSIMIMHLLQYRREVLCKRMLIEEKRENF